MIKLDHLGYIKSIVKQEQLEQEDLRLLAQRQKGLFS